MKRMKKAVALLLTLLMLLSLSACGKSDIIGRWECKLDMTEDIINSADSIFSAYDALLSDGVQAPRMADYMDEFSLTYTMVFNEDGSYSAGVDKAQRQAAVDGLVEAVKEYMYQLFFVILADSAKQMGLEQQPSSREELEAMMGVSMNEAISEVLGIDLETYIESMLGSAMNTYLSEGIADSEGIYETRDGRLYLSKGLDGEIFDEVYDPYTVEGDTLTITLGPEGMSSSLKNFYPLVLNRVG